MVINWTKQGMCSTYWQESNIIMVVGSKVTINETFFKSGAPLLILQGCSPCIWLLLSSLSPLPKHKLMSISLLKWLLRKSHELCRWGREGGGVTYSHVPHEWLYSNVVRLCYGMWFSVLVSTMHEQWAATQYNQYMYDWWPLPNGSILWYNSASWSIEQSTSTGIIGSIIRLINKALNLIWYSLSMYNYIKNKPWFNFASCSFASASYFSTLSFHPRMFPLACSSSDDGASVICPNISSLCLKRTWTHHYHFNNYHHNTITNGRANTFN